MKSKFVYFERLITELKKRKIRSEILNSINQNIEEVNSFSGLNKELRKQICKSQSEILKLLEKELKLVPKNLYRSRWTALGMSVFGVPFGVVFGTSLNNMAFLEIGAGMDKKTFEEGKQLEIEIKY